MAYTPTTWTTGDTITATKLNKLENGVANAGSALIVYTNSSTTATVGEIEYGETLNATFAEIYDALADGVPVYIRKFVETNGYATDYACSAGLYSVLCAYKYATNYRIYAVNNYGWYYGSKYHLGQPAIVTFSASSPSSYPTASVNTISQSVLDPWD